MRRQVVTELDARFSLEGSEALTWEAAEELLVSAELYWLSSVRPDGRPHVTPLVGVWHDEALHFCTGPQERKAANLAVNTAVVVSTGCNRWDRGVDVVVEGAARRVAGERALVAVADAYREKYGSAWDFSVEGDAFTHHGGLALVFRVDPVQAFAFTKGSFAQTRFRFG